MFHFLKTAFSRLYREVSTQFHALFTRSTIDQATLQELEKILITADTGTTTTRAIINEIRKRSEQKTLTSGADLKNALYQALTERLVEPPQEITCPVFLLVGVNGSGKTTAAGKLAHYWTQQGKRVLLVAADTFRAAAPAQLAAWAHAAQGALHVGMPGQDPAAVVFQACEQYIKEAFDILIIDTAGRVQTKTNLMKELEKIRRTLTRQLPTHAVCTLLVLDAMLGQNAQEQARLFHESTQLTGLILTKADGTGKGGALFGISTALKIPVFFISYGEGLTEFRPFVPHLFVQQLLGD